MPEALDHLRRLTGDPAAEFREHQLEAVRELVERRGRVLCVQRTGWGKSAVYFVATRMLRDRGSGPALLISPLLALMRDQVRAAARMGLTARTVNSSNRDDWDATFAELRAGGVDLLLVSPERLNNPAFRAEVLPGMLESVGLLVVDEAHCISDWGHDFRPDYRRIATLVDDLPERIAVLGTTATANDRVVADVEAQLASGTRGLVTFRGPLDRPALRLEVVDLPAPADRLAWLATHLPDLPGSGIVYCLTVRDALMVADWLRARGIAAESYTGESDAEDRPAVERRLLANEVKAVVATSALGMGYDKPDLGFAVHFQSPGSPIAYYQQVGRAGRALAAAEGVLLRGAEDTRIQDWFIDVAFPPEEQVTAVLDVLAAAPGGVGPRRIEEEVNVRRGRLEAMLKVLEVEGAVERRGSKWARTGRPWAYDAERVERVTAQRRAEQEAMRRYARAEACLMAQLRAELDDPGAEPCGRCAVCTAPRRDGPLDPALVRAAVAHIRDRPIDLPVRRQWPTGPSPRRIPPERQAEPGRALARLGDAGWGRVVAAARAAGGPAPAGRAGGAEARPDPFDDEDLEGFGSFDEAVAEASGGQGAPAGGRGAPAGGVAAGFGDDLVAAAAEAIAAWEPVPRPAWVTCVPSRRRPDLVPCLAARLAAALGLPFAPAVRQVRDTASQDTLENSAQQAANVRGAYVVDPSGVRPAPVLLVDDVWSSGWTATAVAVRLREAGSGPVVPFVLALAGP